MKKVFPVITASSYQAGKDALDKRGTDYIELEGNMLLVGGNIYINLDENTPNLPDLSCVILTGDFGCSGQKLRNLKGSPAYVGGNFDCAENKLTSLEGAPQFVEGSFLCFDNELTNLKGSPKSVGKNFICSRNKLTSLEGAPQSIKKEFCCWRNQLTDLKGAPQFVGEKFTCSENKLTSLEGGPQSFGEKGYTHLWKYDCTDNNLSTLKGAPKHVHGHFLCSGNELTSLEGAPEFIENTLDCTKNKITSLKDTPKEFGYLISDLGDFDFSEWTQAKKKIKKKLEAKTRKEKEAKKYKDLPEMFAPDQWIGKTDKMKEAWEETPKRFKKKFNFSAALTKARQKTLLSKKSKGTSLKRKNREN